MRSVWHLWGNIYVFRWHWLWHRAAGEGDSYSKSRGRATVWPLHVGVMKEGVEERGTVNSAAAAPPSWPSGPRGWRPWGPGPAWRKRHTVFITLTLLTCLVESSLVAQAHVGTTGTGFAGGGAGNLSSVASKCFSHSPWIVSTLAPYFSTVYGEHLLIDGVVVASEGVECTQLSPAHTQFLGCTAPEATDVCADQRDAQDVECQHAWTGRATEAHSDTRG